MKINAVPGHVFVKRDTEKKETTTASGIVLTDQYTKRNGNMVNAAIGEVLSCGEMTKDYQFQFAVGSKVLYNPYDGFEVLPALLGEAPSMDYTFDLVPFRGVMGIAESPEPKESLSTASETAP